VRSESLADALPLSLLSDQPADEDQLNFAPYAQTLAEVIADGSTQTPLTIGVFGSWGSGKTSLMAMIKRRLDALRREGRRSGQEVACPHLTVWFNAWLYGQEQALWRALILHVLAEVRRARGDDAAARAELDRLVEQISRVAGSADLGSLSITAADLLREEGSGSARITLALQPGLDLLESVVRARRGGKHKRAEAAEFEHNLVVTHGQGAFGSRKSERARKPRDPFVLFVSFRAFRGPKPCMV
jgi:hypothetical protein